MFKVSIVEDDVSIRNGIVRFIKMQEEFRFIQSYGSVEEYLAGDDEIPDVLLLDIELPGMTGLEGLFHIKQKHPNTEVLMLTVYEDKERIFKALQAGAGGYLLKNTSLPKIRASILEALDGGAPMSPLIAKKVLSFFAADTHQAQTASASEEQLTSREIEVARSLIDGNTYKQVAYYLHISPGTVKQHIKNIYRKLEVNSRVQLIKEFNKVT
jgi:DNA-binding NarL/FixJ family response regulator